MDARSPEGFLGVDVGGTTVKGVRRSPDGATTAQARRPTRSPDPTGEHAAATVVEVVDALGGAGGAPVGVALPGIVDEEDETAVFSANLGWRDVPAGHLLRTALGGPVVVGHDVRAGALAEARSLPATARRGVVAFVAVGTGISAAVLVDGRPVVSGGWAGEIGQLVVPHGPFAGQRVESVASAASTARRAGAPDARTVAGLVRAGDPAAARVWTQTVEVLAGSLAGLVGVLAPTTVVVGGGLALAGDLLLRPLADALARQTPGLRLPVLVPAVHGDAAAALGAALMAQDASAPPHEGGGRHRG